MIAVSGLSESDPRAVYRREVCQFIDDRLSPAQKLGFIHGLLRRDMAEVRMFLERIEGLFAVADRKRAANPVLRAGARRDRARRRHARPVPALCARTPIGRRFAPA